MTEAMSQRVEAVLDAIRDSTDSQPFDAGFVQRSVAQLQALQPLITEADRRSWLDGYRTLARWLELLAPEEVRADFHTQREQIEATFGAMYGHDDTPYLQANRIVEALAARLNHGDDPSDALADALNALTPLADADAAIFTGALLRAQSMWRTMTWLHEPPRDDPIDRQLVTIVQRMQAAAKTGTLTVDDALGSADLLPAGADSAPAQRAAVADALQVVYGLMLLHDTAVAPGLEPLRDRIYALLSAPGTAGAEPAASAGPAPSAVAEPSAAERFAAILQTQAAALARGEFSEFLLRTTMAELQAVPIPTADDAKSLQDALVRMVEQALPYATADARPALEVMRQQLVDLRDQAVDAPPSTEEAIATMRASVQALRAELAAGGDPGAAVLRASGAVQQLAVRMDAVEGDPDPRLVQEFAATMSAIAAAVAPYAKDGDQAVFAEVRSAADTLFARMPGVVATEDPNERALGAEAMRAQLDRLVHAGDWQAVAPQLRDQPHVLQVLQLLPSLMERTAQLRLDLPPGGEEEQELTRLVDRIKEAMGLMGAATVEEQFMRPQRSVLRRAALELRQFERRRHLMLARPAWPATTTTAGDANAVFVSGSGSAAELVQRACDSIGLHRLEPPPTDHPVQARWQALRHAAVGVFDFTGYDPRRADSGARLPRSRTGEQAVLRAAGPVASVAYECGWALALGTAIIVLAKEGQPVPFDIDIAPLRLTGDAEVDAPRLRAALQAAIYGVQRGAAGDGLSGTLTYARRVLGQAAGPLLAAAGGGDATRAQQALAAAVARAEAPGWTLLRPALSPAYPEPEAPSLFHVSAFRPWSLPAQDVLRDVCRRRGIAYRIGYERLEPDVLGVIWADLCRADHVVCDLTQLNPNAVFELGVAHAIGRPVLLVTRDAEPHPHFAPIRSLRTHRYDAVAEPKALAALVESLVDGAP